jgi:predicted nucleic acid-binding protein
VILVDTSVWIDHFHKGIPSLAEILERTEILTHPFVIGELACSSLARRREVLALLADLPASSVATDGETLLFIERHRLMGKGLGYIDAHLLAATLLTDGAALWTRDKTLRGIAAKLRIGFVES